MAKQYYNGGSVTECLQRTETISKSYAAGTPLYFKAQLLQLDDFLKTGSESVTIVGLDGEEFEITRDSRNDVWQCRDGFVRRISVENFYSPRSALGISYTSNGSGFDYPLAGIQAEYATYQSNWLKSTPYQALQKILNSSLAKLDITNIIAFGLGSLRVGEHASRSHTQHAAVLTMASTIEKLMGRKVDCYVQDPSYNTVDAEFLNSKGITILEDPHGFLNTNSNTLVFSVCPNVPVKQIIADMTWPAAMIWDTVDTTEEQREWRTEVFDDGEAYRVSPYGTDPDSSRVREMVQHYDHLTFVDKDEQFTCLTVYTRKLPMLSETGIEMSVKL
ncbi:hypothetical protein EJ08DRAFT_683597 [Tothia fuscella]|uniref:SRR1-like domain-containing protein n=1 Tax=Tothia fuscella TaxID=1048955 RepID=A0A9P4TTF2_9PEZI|nr:hypothetical protein EJ08DRAFT_683597 [Tothia fuscella]